MSKAVESFGKYILLEKLASGGMAEVYLAKSPGASGINKFIAIKRILPQYSDHPEFIEMFKEEANIAVNLNHGNVVSIYDFGIERKQFFLVMEYVEGQNLRQILNHLKKDNKYFSIDQIVYMGKEVAAGLDHAHRCLNGTTGKPLHITHRDMSPQNIMVSFEGEVKIVDFGIAKKAESEIEATRAGTIKGKFGYMSPEQADGQNVDLRTDIFSLGIVMWELLANDRLFTSQSEAATLRKIRECQIPPLRKLNPSIPPELERIINKALAKDKSLRYQTAASLHRDLNRFLNTQYPEFSPHDFSVFMKSAFSTMFMDNRKKLIEFAKVKGDDLESHTLTSTLTETEDHSGGHDVENTDNNLKLDLGEEASGAPVDLSDLTKKAPTKQPAFFDNHNNHERMNRTQSGARAQTHTMTKTGRSGKVSTSRSWTGTVMLVFSLMLAGGGGWYVWEGKFLNTNIEPIPPVAIDVNKPQVVTIPEDPNTTLRPGEPKPGEGSFASEKLPDPPAVPQPPTPTPNLQRELYTIIIQSNPTGARIAIDGQDTGMITPAQRSIEYGKEFSLSLRKEGYQYYERKEIASQKGLVIKASLLPMPKMGYINLELVNGGLNPVVIINGVRIDEKLPLKNYAVIAGTPVKIQAHNPFTGLSGEQTVRVGANQKIQVNLLLTQRKSAETK
ncbi:MAG: protein kinase domain-containing protein [Pseudobdellovibrionaceae bacterium]